jgi:hypothetical protein
MTRATLGLLQSVWSGRCLPGCPELTVGAGELLAKLADFGGQFAVAGVCDFQAP